ncbi:uncharacterized protein LOC114472247 isoform X2 [Gouania willdenowi]|uniref:Interphotoreceptor matrix proteoglycan 2-like n=1 Tax=Gouania willdenowi TaxID=441366 RepID=A0A8C5DBF9_GOUWI|nr:uncharacterized protein LOC114472247 isoform X2 [Gouania willdenowi]
MQLHVYLLLFVITTDKTLASNSDCGGNISLDREPYGHVNLTLSTLFTDTNTLHPINQQPNKNTENSTCLWTIHIPAEKTVLLKSLWMGTGWSLSVRCSWNENPQLLESGMIALLSGCDQNKAVLNWTGTRRSSNVVQLAYYVQDDEGNSWDDRSSHRPNQYLSGWTQKETTSISVTPAGHQQLGGTEGERGRLHEGLELSSVLQSVLGVSSEDSGLPHPSSVQQGLSVSVSTDRETLTLPEEKPYNGADTSAAAHLTDTVTATHGAQTYSQPVPNAQTSLDITDRPSMEFDTPTQLSKNTEKHTISHTLQSVSSSTFLPTAFPLSSLEDDTFPKPHSEATGENQPNSWRSFQSTDDMNLDLTSSTNSSSLKSFTEPPKWDLTVDDLSSPSVGPSTAASFTSHATALSRSEAASHRPHTNHSDSLVAAVQLSEPRNTAVLNILSSSTQSHTNPPQSSGKISHSSPYLTETMITGTQSVITNTIAVSPEVSTSDGGTSAATASFSTRRASLETKKSSSDRSATDSSSLTSSKDSTTHTAFPNPLSTTFAFSLEESITYATSTLSPSSEASRTSSAWTDDHPSTFSKLSPSHQQPNNSPSPPALAAATTTDDRDKKDELFYQFFSNTSKTKTQPGLTLQTVPPHSQENHSVLTSSAFTANLLWSSTSVPKFYIVPDQLVTISVDSFELLMQIVVEESRAAVAPGLEEDTAAWVEPYLQRAPGFSRLLGVWSSGHAVQSLVEFKTSGAFQWLSKKGATSLLEQTGLTLAVDEGRTFRSSKITNITIGGLQSDVCVWLLQCPSGYKCVSQPTTANYSCSSVCHFDHCHHHGMCTHHPGQLPVCRCLAGDDFWYMGHRCDVRMTRARLVGACLAVLVIAVAIIGVLAFVAVRRYKAIVIQAKVDQTRSSYHRFNHFDELSGRFWLRSWAESADSLDNPGFTRSDELLHLRALDRPCCYHDDTLSLPSTCASHGTRINTIYPHSSQYGWRGSTMSVGDGVLDSGKASDLSVCSWPVEPIHWTPFPLLQQLASHRTPTVRVSRTRSYCEGMELVDMGKSWTA